MHILYSCHTEVGKKTEATRLWKAWGVYWEEEGTIHSLHPNAHHISRREAGRQALVDQKGGRENM